MYFARHIAVTSIELYYLHRTDFALKPEGHEWKVADAIPLWVILVQKMHIITQL